jgi:hypothetical protein
MEPEYDMRTTFGFAYKGKLCSCQSVGFTKMQPSGDSDVAKRTWLTVAHEIGHNFGASHLENEGGGDEDTGMMTYYNNGAIDDVYKFADEHRKSMCATITDSFKGGFVPPRGIDFSGGNPQCLHAYFGIDEYDGRFGFTYMQAVIIYITLAAFLFLFMCSTAVFAFLYYKNLIKKEKVARHDMRLSIETGESHKSSSPSGRPSMEHPHSHNARLSAEADIHHAHEPSRPCKPNAPCPKTGGSRV